MSERRRRTLVMLVIALIVASVSAFNQLNDQTPAATSRPQSTSPAAVNPEVTVQSGPASDALERLAVKGRASKTDYAREQFSDGWADVEGCDMRNWILKRDLTDVKLDTDNCIVLTGTLHDPYTSKIIQFQRGQGTSDDVQIDHVVALSDAWQKGAQALDEGVRAQFANDPLNLLAVDGPTNNKKSDSDAATWLPPNKDYRCRYVARQIAVKAKYTLWVSPAEKTAMQRQLALCPGQVLPIISD